MNPFFYLLLAVIPLAVAARWKRAYPSQRLVWLALVPGLFSLSLLAFGSALLPAVLIVDGAALLAAAIDLFTLPAASAFAVERQTVHIASLQKPHRVTLLVMNRAAHTYQAAIRDGYPAEFDAAPADFRTALSPTSRSTMHYDFSARRRGAFMLREVYVQVHSRLGFWVRYLTYPAETAVHVYPDMKQLAEYAILARTNRLSLMGVRRTRRVGQDNEFERLRDYTPDDDYKHIHWRSTARRSKLTVKEFQANQSQRIVFLVDCGRMMTNEAAGISLLDHALNSMLMLSYVALRQGDSVGLVCFSDQIHRFVPLRGGMRQMNQLVARVVRPLSAAGRKSVRRGVFVFCGALPKAVARGAVDERDRRGELEPDSAVSHGRSSGGTCRWRCCCAITRCSTRPRPAPMNDQALYRAAAAAEILTWRQQVLADLSAAGVLSLDLFPEELTAPLVNRYLDIKARHLL